MNTKTKTGWMHIETIDLRMTDEEPGHCDRCDREDLRYLHIVEHPEKGTMHVGCECAKRLCWGYNPKRDENRLRNLYNRRSRWLTRNWATSWKGNAYLEFKHEGEQIQVTIFPNKFNPAKFRYCISVAENGKPIYSPENYTSSDEAKLEVFDHLAEMLDW